MVNGREGRLRPVRRAGMRLAGVAPVAAVSHAVPDRAPAEVALLGVCGAVLIAVAAAVIRSGRVRGWRPSRAVPDTAQVRPVTPAEPEVLRDSGRDTDSSTRRVGAGLLASAVAAIVAAGGVATAVVVLGGHATVGRGSAPIAAISPLPGQAPVMPASGSTAPRQHLAKGAHSAASSGPGTSGHGGTAASGSGSAHTPGGQTTSPSSPTTSPPPPGTLSLPSTARCLGLTTYICSFTVTAVGGAAGYSVSAPGGGVSITNASGTLGSGQNAIVRVSMPVDSAVGYVTVNPGGATVSFIFPAPRPSPCQVRPPLQCP